MILLLLIKKRVKFCFEIIFISDSEIRKLHIVKERMF